MGNRHLWIFFNIRTKKATFKAITTDGYALDIFNSQVSCIYIPFKYHEGKFFTFGDCERTLEPHFITPTDGDIKKLLLKTGRFVMPRYHDITRHRQLLKLYEENKTDNEIAEEMHMAIKAVVTWRRRHKLPFIKEKSDDETNTEIRKFHSLGFSSDEIGKMVDLTSSTVRRRLNKLGIKPNNPTIPRVCDDCGKPFVAGHTNAKRCKVCADINKEMKYLLYKLRAKFSQLAEANPTEAMKLLREMEEIEGILNTTDLVGQEIIDKIRRKYEAFGYLFEGEEQ